MHEELTEHLIQYFSKDPYIEDFARAKEMYMKAVGTVVEEHQYFDTWISGFFEWFLIDYKMQKFGVPPIFLFQRVFSEKLDPKEMEFLREMEKCSLELLEVSSVSAQKIKAYNIFLKQNVEFQTFENTSLLNKGDYIVTRINMGPQRNHSFGVMWHLSSEIASIINKRLESIKKITDQEMFLYELIKRKTQSEIYSHVPLEQIFGWKTGAEFKLPARPVK
jgi:hypothetical protein